MATDATQIGWSGLVGGGHLNYFFTLQCSKLTQENVMVVDRSVKNPAQYTASVTKSGSMRSEVVNEQKNVIML